MKCSTCGQDNRSGRKFCGNCGEELFSTCGSCGARNEREDQFCGQCGERIPAHTTLHFEDMLLLFSPSELKFAMEKMSAPSRLASDEDMISWLAKVSSLRKDWPKRYESILENFSVVALNRVASELDLEQGAKGAVTTRLATRLAGERPQTTSSPALSRSVDESDSEEPTARRLNQPEGTWWRPWVFMVVGAFGGLLLFSFVSVILTEIGLASEDEPVVWNYFKGMVYLLGTIGCSVVGYKYGNRTL